MVVKVELQVDPVTISHALKPVAHTFCKHGFWAWGALIPEEPRLRVLEAESALEAFGEPDSSHTNSAGCAFLTDFFSVRWRQGLLRPLVS